MFRDSSAVEQSTVNRSVPGSNPGRGAISLRLRYGAIGFTIATSFREVDAAPKRKRRRAKDDVYVLCIYPAKLIITRTLLHWLFEEYLKSGSGRSFAKKHF